MEVSFAQRLEVAHTWRGVKYAQAQARLMPHSGSQWEALGGGFMIYAGPNSPLNKTSGLGFGGEIKSSDLDRLEDFYFSKDALPRIELCPLADPALISQLNKRGYRLESFMNVLYRPVPAEPLPIQLPADAAVRRALPNEADLWIRTTAQGFEATENPSQAGLAIMAPNFHSEIAACYFAWWGKAAAAGAAMATYGDVTEFGGTSTRTAFRRHGLQRALLHTRLNDAREIGCSTAMVLTSPGSKSQRNIERVGFVLAYTKVVVALSG